MRAVAEKYAGRRSTAPSSREDLYAERLERWGRQLRIHDATIVEAAVRAGCDELWTEDLPDGRHAARGARARPDPFADA